MKIQIALCKRWFVIAFILGTTSVASAAQSQSFTAKAPAETAGSGYAASMPLTSDDIIVKMLDRNRVRSERLERYSSVRTYEVRNLQGKLAAQTVVRVDYEAPDKKTFDKTSERGSGIVRHLVFDHLIESGVLAFALLLAG